MKKSVWKLEETYWQFVKAGDVDHYRTLWHDDFIGWPVLRMDADRQGRRRQMGQRHSRQSLEVELFAQTSRREVIRRRGVVHYAAEYVYDYGDGTTSGAGIWRKFTHTWMKAGNSWQIIGGMCAAQEPIKTPRA
jgi:hypothetical protein